MVDSEPSTAAETERVKAACDCTFVWPLRYAIEKVLLADASDATIGAFIEHVTDRLGDDYFVNAGSPSKDAEGKREAVLRYLKDKKADHRLFAEMLPLDEISHLAERLMGELNALSPGLCPGKEVKLAD